MIKLINEIPSFKKQNGAYAKICSHFAAYSPYQNIALFWAQFDDNNNPTALFSMIDSVMMLCFDNGDLDELRSFLRAIAPKKIFTDLDTTLLLGLNIEVSCSVLYKRPPFESNNQIENTYCGIDSLYDILSERLNVGDRQAFIADMSHRIRHNAAAYVSSPFSAAAIIFDKNVAVINGIAVSKENAGKGLGSATLNRLLDGMKNRTVFVCAEEKNVPFYEKNGFVFCENAAYSNTNGVF